MARAAVFEFIPLAQHIVRRATLNDWGVEEGGYLNLGARSIRAPVDNLSAHAALDEHKRRLAAAVASRFTPQHIRAHGLANLHRWKAKGVWASAYDEWERLLTQASDGELFAAMLGPDQRANQLRQSPPYVGMLPRHVVHKLNEEAAG